MVSLSFTTPYCTVYVIYKCVIFLFFVLISGCLAQLVTSLVASTKLTNVRPG